MNLIQKLSKQEFETLLTYKPVDLNLEVLEKEIQEKGYSKILFFYSEIVEQKTFNKVQSKEAISWTIEYISWHIKNHLFNN